MVYVKINLQKGGIINACLLPLLVIMPGKDNLNPVIHEKTTPRFRIKTEDELDNNVRDPFDQREIFDLIRDINDPEHPLTLEDLHVVSEEDIVVDDKNNIVSVSDFAIFFLLL